MTELHVEVDSSPIADERKSSTSSIGNTTDYDSYSYYNYSSISASSDNPLHRLDVDQRVYLLIEEQRVAGYVRYVEETEDDDGHATIGIELVNV